MRRQSATLLFFDKILEKCVDKVQAPFFGQHLASNSAPQEWPEMSKFLLKKKNGHIYLSRVP